MVITKTPLRISFFSGGSDLPSFYRKEKGAALSVTIDKFIYVCVHRTPHLGIKIMYDAIEEFPDVELMQHAITRESLKYFGVDKEITIASISDIMAKGSGLGSSSAFTVGLVNALANPQYQSLVSREYLATTACEIEMNRCMYPIGKQDQYAAAFGGLNLFEFNTDDTVNIIHPVLNNKIYQELNDNLLLVYSGRGRSANSILQKQSAAMSDKVKFDLVKRSRDKAYVGARYLRENKLDDFGDLLHMAWTDKKAVVTDITQDYFDDIYDRARKAGAIGGKLLGAGGGGFFLFYVKPENRERVIHEITDDTECKVYDFTFTESGSKVTSYF